MATLRDRRGASAVVFASSAIVIMGFVGLATEAGTWYLGRRDAQNAADAAAVAGALASIYGANATTSATSIAAQNGFTAGANVAVAINTVPVAGANSQIQVTVSQTMVPLITSLFGIDPVTIGATAAAQVKSIGSACALALSGDLRVTGTSISSACAFAGNGTSSTAVSVTGALLASTATAVGGCCGAGTVTLSGRPSSPYHPLTTNPYAAADALTLPSFSAASCDAIPAAVLVAAVPTITLVPYNPASPRAYCSNLVVSAGITVAVPSGTYFFNNASLTVNGGKITCQTTCAPGASYGTTFVFTGATGSIGTIAITTGWVTLIPLKNNANFPALNGILFYGRGLGTATVAAANTAGRQPIGGALYFPYAALQFTGNTASPSSCLSLVALSLTLYSTSRLATTACANYGTTLASMQGARIVQ